MLRPGLQQPATSQLLFLLSCVFDLNEKFIAPINIKTYMMVTKMFHNYNQFTTYPNNYVDDCDSSKITAVKTVSCVLLRAEILDTL
jgi:ABC-type spermidine/putrescine transport system permease subunit I